MSHRILIGDCREQLRSLPEKSVHCVITSPPYFGLRDYGHDSQIGQEVSPSDFVETMLEVFREVHRVLRDDGTLWLNLGDSYAGSGKGRNADGSANVDPNSKQATSLGTILGTLQKSTPDGLKAKDLMGIPWEVALALRNDGWYLRQDIIWHKPNAMPSSVSDRCTTSHEYLFLLTKKPRYYYDAEAIKEPAIYAGDNRGARKDSRRGMKANSMSGSTGAMKNRRSVWTINTKPYKGAHFATFPPTLVEPCILAGTSEHGCCANCGTSYIRLVEKGEPILQAWSSKGAGQYDIEEQGMRRTGLDDGSTLKHIVPTVTVGWERDCVCDTDEVVPCTVLDPFAGSGTTLAVAKQLGRFGVGCELNSEYAKLADARIASVNYPEPKLF
jgi:DNA modification methylase